MKIFQYKIWLATLVLGLVGCDGVGQHSTEPAPKGHEGTAAAEPAKGPHGGRMLLDGDFALELAIFETGVPPEFRVWVTNGGAPVSPEDVKLQITLTRLGDVRDEIDFVQQDDFLRGDTVIYEPHSFVVSIEALYRDKAHRWEYDNFEGRTRIGAEMAQAFGLETEIAEPGTIEEAITAYGRIVPDNEKVRAISARFDGVIDSVLVSVGDNVKQGQTLASVESNESLRPYTIVSPIDGVVTERAANQGEQTNGRRLFTIMDMSSVWAELAVFPSDRGRVVPGAVVAIQGSGGTAKHKGVVSQLNAVAEPNQSILARVVLDNREGTFVPGTYVTGEIHIAEHAVPITVKRVGLQSFRDFTVVYAQIGDEFEVRMLELGRQDGEWIEVLGGLEPGTRYVTTNSYLIKADIEKSGASHDH